MKRLLIVNAKIINEGEIGSGDVFVRNGRIEAIGSSLGHKPADRVIDAEGRALFPGMIDDQVHFREPGLTHKGCIASETRAAVAGGITSIMEMPNTEPATTTRELLSQKFQLAHKQAFANYSFYLGATNTNLEDIKAVKPEETCGIKVFMGSSTGDLLVDDPLALAGIFEQAPVLVATHCEDDPTIAANLARFKSQYGMDIPMQCHPLIRSETACYRSSAHAVALARQYDTRLHILHLTTARELDLLSDAPLEQKRITGEVCVHHLYFSDADYAAKGTWIKCNPAIKTDTDRKALLDAVAGNRIDVIATDHAPHTAAEKQHPYLKAPSGLPLVQHAFMALLEHYHAGVLTLPIIAEKTSHAPARLFEIKERGFIREGYWADLTLVDLAQPFEVNAHPIWYQCGWTPFEGITFKSSIVATVVSGHLAYHAGTPSSTPAGRRLEFER
jgi:dihydroorotase